MAATVTGSYTATFTANTLMPVSATNLNAYSVPVSYTYTQTYASGSTASSILKTATITDAGTGATSWDLFVTTSGATSVLCADGTYGFTHIREVMIVNRAATTAFLLLMDSSAANTWLDGTIITTSGTTAKISIPAGSCFHMSCPINTAGWVVDNTHKVLKLDPGGNTVPYTVILAGDSA